MNKEQLIEKINKIPKFVLRDISIQKGINKKLSEDGKAVYENGFNEWVENENWKAVTEVGNIVPLAFVGKRYQLIDFDKVFLPLIENVPELNGEVIYYGGMGFMDVFPADERLKINGGDDRIGMGVVNSVNKTSSVIIKFCIKHDNKKITIPTRLAGFKRMHVGKTIQVTQNFLAVVDKVRRIWKTILEEFTKVKVDEAYANLVLDDVNIKDQHIRKKVVKRILSSSDMNLWDLFMYVIEIVEERSFKSDVHRRKKLDLISDKLFKYAVTSRLLNA